MAYFRVEALLAGGGSRGLAEAVDTQRGMFVPTVDHVEVVLPEGTLLLPIERIFVDRKGLSIGVNDSPALPRDGKTELAILNKDSFIDRVVLTIK